MVFINLVSCFENRKIGNVCVVLAESIISYKIDIKLICRTGCISSESQRNELFILVDYLAHEIRKN